MEPLASSNPKIKRLRRLAGRRGARVDEGAFVIEGPINVAEAIRCGVELDDVLVDQDEPAIPWLDRSVTVVRSGVLGAVLSTESPQPIAAIAPAKLHRLLDDLVVDSITDSRPLLVLVDVADPGNAGTLLRSADAAGVAGVVFAGRSVEPYSPKVVRSSAGSLFRVPFAIESDLDVVFESLGPVPSFAAAASGRRSHLDTDFTGPSAFVLGNEAHGLSEAVIERCTSTLRVEMEGPTESLNVAMAGTVLLFESMRQRRGAVDHNDAR